MSDIVHDICIIGTGFAGLCAGIHLRDDGANVVLLEAAETVGGTWRDNRYPGVACDVQSHLYSLSFAPNPEWTRTFAGGAEIQAYLEAVTETHELRPLIRFDTRVLSAVWCEEQAIWRVQTTQGEVCARVLVPAVGGLSVPKLPNIPGLDDFGGQIFHTQDWPADLDMSGKRVGVIGTGASAIQLIPEMAQSAASVRVFQRTPAWVIAKPDRAISGVERWAYRRVPLLLKARRWGLYWQLESRAVAFIHHPRLLQLFEWRARAHIRREVVDPELCAKLTPSYKLGCKRILMANNYYPALQQSHVVVDTDSIEGVESAGVRTDELHELDVLVLATGFAATEGIRFPVQGRGQDLSEAWSNGMEAYLGISVARFPNLFLLAGPNTGLGHNSMVFMIESQVAYLRGAWKALSSDASTVEVRPEVQDRFNATLRDRLAGTIWASGCSAWYLDANGRNTTLWPGFTWAYQRETRRFDPGAYIIDGSPPSLDP